MPFCVMMLEAAWLLRTASLEEKAEWLVALESNLSVMRWLSNYRFGRVLGRGASGASRHPRRCNVEGHIIITLFGLQKR